MPALAETQLPLLVRHKNCGLLPQKFPGETKEAFYYRLSRIYYVSIDDIQKIFASPS